jgi:hypothetical protein
LISARSVFVPDLYERLFNPDYVSPDEQDTDNIVFANTPEELEAMWEAIEAEEAELERQKLYGG